ncbi:MAG: imidazole glycerol phosphate synthase subunit HisH [Cyclobacteriaceae bacterium]|nr:imidazole glycerol phosphate synthase subunit HisH [Cyclobacteriaceae bacterium]
MNIVIIKYNAGNTQSVIFGLNRLGIDPVLTDDPEEIMKADKVIFPGVGEASTTMKYLRDHKLDKVIVNLKQPVLGICLGMQLMCAHSEEGDTSCLGIFDLNVRQFKAEGNRQYKIPQMGWNTLTSVHSPLFDAEMENSHVYFVHGFYVPLSKYTIATTEFIHPYSSAIARDNFYAVQFHPEKSSATGEQILKNFIAL